MKHLNLIRIAGISALLIVVFQAVFAQEGRKSPVPDEKKQKIKAHKIAYITERLQLTPQEAEKFWPVYNEHEAIMEKFHKEFRKSHMFEPSDIDVMSDDDAHKLISDHFQHEQQAFDIRKEFIGKLGGVIPAKKILMLMEAEKDFKVELMRKVTGRNEPPPPGDRELMRNPE
ncbi:MAG: sensor of ECF-type sigma factor [Bacteroidetes bacterium]|nr:sensor of ECF-type sigma factor [Bacteroidota bacterium]